MPGLSLSMEGGRGRGPRRDCRGRGETWMFTPLEVPGPFVNSRTSVLDGRGFTPFAEMYVSAKLALAETGAPRAYPKNSRMEEFGALLAGYARWQAGR